MLRCGVSAFPWRTQAQELCSTLTTAISDKLRYCTVEADNTVFIQGVGYVEATADKIFTADSGQVYLGGKNFWVHTPIRRA